LSATLTNTPPSLAAIRSLLRVDTPQSDPCRRRLRYPGAAGGGGEQTVATPPPFLLPNQAGREELHKGECQGAR
jgi:hypothetical protein